MSGHSKWATTKHKKAAIDAKRGKLFAKLIKNIEIAARQGGGDPDGNPALYDAIYKAKKNSMPADNIKRAVKRGSGEEAGGANYEEIVYEGYAPAGVGLIIECLTDNRNRAAADVRSTLGKGGGDPDGNPALYDAIYKAKKNSMPADNIKRAVKRGSGEEAGGANYEEIVYEGYAPAGVGLIIECLTDNRNRAAADVRSTLGKGGGSLATTGSVSFNFERKGAIEVPAEGVDFDDLFEKAAEAGAEDVTDDGETYTVLTDPSDLIAVRQALQDAGIDYDSAEIVMNPKNEVELTLDDARKVAKLIDNLDDLDDVQNIYSNWTASDEVMAQLDEE